MNEFFLVKKIADEDELNHINAVLEDQGHGWVSATLELNDGARLPLTAIYHFSVKDSGEVRFLHGWLAEDQPNEDWLMRHSGYTDLEDGDMTTLPHDLIILGFQS